MDCRYLILTGVLLSVFTGVASACTSPVVKNEMGVPINIYGGSGYLTIDGSSYPSQQMILYNLSVKNMNSQPFTLKLTPDTNLWNYVYGAEKTFTSNENGFISFNVYVDGPTKIGQMLVTGQCNVGLPIPEGSMNVYVKGKGNGPVQACKNSKTSCGVYPNCEDLTAKDGCYSGYYRSYNCGSNNPMYSESCTNYCCSQAYGSQASCQMESGKNICSGDAGYCTNECSFTGNTCSGNSVYSCQLQQDGCYDLVMVSGCGNNICYQGGCIDSSSKQGKIAYLCRDDSCNYGIESGMISWLQSKNWFVIGKSYKSWSLQELSGYDVIACSDENNACKSVKGDAAYDAHLSGKPLAEIADYRYSNQAYRFGYVSNPYNFINSGSSGYYPGTGDIIIKPFSSGTKIFAADKKMTYVPDYKLASSAKRVAFMSADYSRINLFKMQEGSKGRYAYIGWFYQAYPGELTSEGSQILNRTFVWLACGDNCLQSSSLNEPPVAVASINPYPIAYVGQTVTFDASDSYDPEGQALKYYWDFGDGTNSGWTYSISVTHIYSAPVNFHISLKANDGELNSETVTKSISILPEIKNKVALLCGNDGCSEPSESAVSLWLSQHGYSVSGKAVSSWKKSELNGYDLMICTSAGKGCNLKPYYDAFKKHKEENMGLLEIPDYEYVRAGYSLGYAKWWVGYSSTDSKINIISSDQVTYPNSGKISVFTSANMMGGIFESRIIPDAINLAKSNSRDDVSVQFKVDASQNHGRYAYIGWFYKSRVSDLTPEGSNLLLRTIRWVQCGNAGGC